MNIALPLAIVKTHFEFGRIQAPVDWLLPVGVLLAILAVVFLIYRRDAAELPRWLNGLLLLLRTAVFLGLLVIWIQPQWRTEREIVHPSRVLMLVDTSMSMNRVDVESGKAGSTATRLQQVAGALDDTDFLGRLRKSHEVAVFPFNNALDRDREIVLAKEKSEEEKKAEEQKEGSASELSPGSQESNNGVSAPVSPLPSGDDHASMVPAGVRASVAGSSSVPSAVPFRKHLEPRGTETRLGEALEQVIRDERSSPISGIIVLSDGGQNAGVSPEVAAESAHEARIPIYTVGVGSEQKPASVRIYDFKVPPRAYPGDRYTVTGSVQAQGLPGRSVTVELLAREGAAAKDPAQRGKGERLDRKTITLGGDGEVVPLKFELTPDKTGRRMLCLRAIPPPGDTGTRDKFLEGEVEIVDHKNHVLLFAGGPARDYQYLLTLLHRDRSTTADVLLQTAQPGISQESERILDEFPSRRDAMYSYDCVVAFDPNWQALRPEQVELFEKWVGDEGGGLVAVAGAVYAGRANEGWAQDAEMAKIRNLYPVEFHRHLGLQTNLTYAAKEPWSLEFTREGLEAEYLWLGDTAVASQKAWATAPGIYGFCPVRGPKPGATVLARFSDPRTAEGDKQPVYFAEQFYGSGRVFYMGSGEMWRLRGADPAYLEQFWTKLLRHVSQGRLLRQSSRGDLLVVQDRYLLGQTVEVRARLTNSRLQPLAVPSVTVQVMNNGVMDKPLTLTADPARAGMYLGMFPAAKEGEYRLELPVPESADERLSRTLRAVIPKLEEENPQRNAALLKQVAEKSGDRDRPGAYFADLAAAFSADKPDALAGRLKDMSRTELVPVAPNPKWEEDWLRWMMVGLMAALCLEWLIRRLVKLA